MTTFFDLIRSHQSFLLTGHERPDGDCVGAQAALSQLLCLMGKTVHIVNPDPLTQGFDFLTEHTTFTTSPATEELPDFDVAVLLDCSQLSRVGSLGKRIASRNKPIAVIDHHVGSENGDGCVSYVDVSAAATGALVRRLFAEFDVELTLPAAEGIFLSLVSDTGWFCYSNANEEVFSMAAELVALGVDSLLPSGWWALALPFRALALGEPALLAVGRGEGCGVLAVECGVALLRGLEAPKLLQLRCRDAPFQCGAG